MMAVMYNIVTGDQPELPADFNPSLRILLSMYVYIYIYIRLWAYE